MASIAEINAPAAPDISKMTRVQKLAALLIILGPESAAQILKTLEPHELEQVSAEMARLPMITHALRAEIMREMSEVALTAGTSVRESAQIIKTAGAAPVGVAIALDRQERGEGSMSAVQEAENALGLRVISIVKLETLLNYLEARDGARRYLDAITTYRHTYGA